MSNDKNKKIFKFHGSEVENIIIRYAAKQHDKPDTAVIEEYDAKKDPEPCETINVQVVADFVTITYYRNENENSIIRRELIPSHSIEHIWVKDFAGTGSQPQSFTIDVVGQQFTLRATDMETIQQLIDNYNGKNNFHVTGTLVKGDGGFNSPWSWHLDPSSVRMAESSIELCDGTPSCVEENLDYWLDTVHTYCPWSSKVVSINK
jgi:hypothetical protein